MNEEARLNYVAGLEDKLKLVHDIVYEHCEDYGGEVCRDGGCLGDPDWESCVTRQVLDVLGVEE